MNIWINFLTSFEHNTNRLYLYDLVVDGEWMGQMAVSDKPMFRQIMDLSLEKPEYEGAIIEYLIERLRFSLSPDYIFKNPKTNWLEEGF